MEIQGAGEVGEHSREGSEVKEELPEFGDVERLQVEVTIRHATRAEEVLVAVPASATIGQLKRALLRRVGRKVSTALNVRLATKVGNTFSFYEDAQALGPKRELMVLGLDIIGRQASSATQVLGRGYANIPVTVWLAQEGESFASEVSVTVFVQETATMRQVKDVLAKQLERPEVMSEGQLAACGSEPQPLGDEEALRGRWSLQLLGVEHKAAAGKRVVEPVVGLGGDTASQAATVRAEEREAAYALCSPFIGGTGQDLDVGCAADSSAGNKPPAPAVLWRTGTRRHSAARARGPLAGRKHAEVCGCVHCQRPRESARAGPLELLEEFLLAAPGVARLQPPLPRGAEGGPAPTVTALIATHRGRLSCLRDAVASALGQSIPGLEVVVAVQDLPSRADAEYLGLVRAEAFSRLRNVRIVPASAQPGASGWSAEWSVGDSLWDANKPHRAAFVRNAALVAAAGEYVAFLDDDDVWLPSKLAVQIPRMRVAGSSFSASEALCGPLQRLRPWWPHRFEQGLEDQRFRLYHRDLHRKELCRRAPSFDPDVPCGIREDLLLRHNLLITSTVVISAELLAEMGPMSLDAPWEDYEYWIRAVSVAHEVLHVPEPLAVYDAEHGAATR